MLKFYYILNTTFNCFDFLLHSTSNTGVVGGEGWVILMGNPVTEESMFTEYKAICL